MSLTTPETIALVTFARSVLNVLTVWPALRIAITQGWGPSSHLPLLAEDLVDLFYQTALSPPSSTSTSSNSNRANGASGDTPVPELWDLQDLLLHFLSNGFQLQLDDDSETLVARDLVKLWRECLTRAKRGGEVMGEGEEGLLEKWERAARKAREEDGVRGYAVQRGGDDDSESGDESGEEGMEMEGEDEEMGQGEGEGEGGRVGERKREEPVVDEDGFQMVAKKGGRR